MKFSIIVAMGRDRSIGAENRLLWHLPSDLKRFKQLTTGHAILMGRHTWESLPNGALPNRRNVVVSRSLERLEGAELFPSLEDALRELADQEEVFVIGGGQIYEQLLPMASTLYLTLVDADFPSADTFFPELDWSEWDIQEEVHCPSDERNCLDSVYYRAVRK